MPDQARGTGRRILLTGATGFVGRFVYGQLVASGFDVIAAGRRSQKLGEDQQFIGFDLEAPGAIDPRALTGVETVIHLAALAHQPDCTDAELYMRMNCQATQVLARSAAAANVQRFVFLSTVKVNGEAADGIGFREKDLPNPVGPYAVSKHCAETFLVDFGRQSGLETCIVRSPLVFGPGVKGNFLRMLSWVDGGLPLPFGSIRNRRSYISAWSLADFISLAVQHPLSVNRTWLVADDPPVSTRDLAATMAIEMGRRPKLIKVSPRILEAAGLLCGRTEEVRRLCDSLVVDASPAKKELGWTPSCTIRQGIARTVAWYRSRQ